MSSPFLPVSRPSRDDANDLDGLSVIVSVQDRVGHQKQAVAVHGPQGPPPWLTAFDAVLLRKGERISKRPDSRLAVNTMLTAIARRLIRIPFEPNFHLSMLLQNRIYTQCLVGGCGEQWMIARRQSYRRT
jgi:hypothetical protein